MIKAKRQFTEREKQIRLECLRQKAAIGALLPPHYCTVCAGCAHGLVVKIAVGAR